MSGSPRGWVETTIGDVCSYIQRGKSPKYTEKSDLPIINQKCVRWWGIDERYLKFVDPAQWPSWTEERFLAPGDVLWNSTGTGTIGRAALFEGLNSADRVVVDSHVTILRPGGAVSGAFLHRFIQSPRVQNAIADMQSGTTNQVELNRTEIIETALLLPPLTEQKRIVDKLDALSAKSARAHTELARIETLVSRYKQAVLSKAFIGELTREWRNNQANATGWSKVVISDISEVVTGSTPKTAEKDRFFGGDTPFFKPTDLDQGYHVETPRETLSAAGVAVSRLVPALSVLVTCIGATIGKVGFARVACCTNQQINALVPKIALAKPEWLYWVVSAPEFQAIIVDNSSATTLPIINKGRFQQLPLGLPPLEEQHEIVRRIESAFAKIDRLAREAKRALELVGRLDEAILTKAFRGELVPQDDSDEPAEKLLERIRTEREAAPKGKSKKIKRVATMSTALDFLDAKLKNWPAGGVSFQDLKREFAGSYDDLKDALFASLSDEHSPLQQIFDEKTSTMAIRKRER